MILISLGRNLLRYCDTLESKRCKIRGSEILYQTEKSRESLLLRKIARCTEHDDDCVLLELDGADNISERSTVVNGYSRRFNLPSMLRLVTLNYGIRHVVFGMIDQEILVDSAIRYK